MHEKSTRAREGVQLSAAGIAIGVVGCVIITASSVYTALKMGALPWPTIFTSITALVCLRAFGRRSLNEANVTQIVMSAGSMVAGGLAFTIPGIWMLGLSSATSWPEMLSVALAGTLLGLVCTALIRKRFVDESDLDYPVGTAAAQTLRASRAGGRTGRRLFGSMAMAGAWCALRDALGLVPTLLLQLPVPGVAFGVYDSPMMLSVGFLMGGAAAAFWLVGALVGQLGAVTLASAAGLWTLEAGQGIASSLGMGLMMGSGAGVIVHDLVPKAARALRASRAGSDGEGAEALTDVTSRLDRGALALLVAAAALLACFALGLGPVVAAVVVLLSFVTTVMSAQSVGQTGIDPMEIFGLIVLLVVAALGGTDQARLFYVAGVIAVACGVGGDVMSDFKTGALIGTDPRSMWFGQVLGSLVGVVVATATMCALVGAYGTGAFGPGQAFVSAQASVVATMVSGIPSPAAFGAGLAAGVVLYCLGVPSMMLGLGAYLPLYMTLTGALGALAKVAYDRLGSRGRAGAEAGAATGAAAPQPGGETLGGELSHEDNGIVVASGLLGGESVVGVLIALASVVAGLLA